MEPELEKAVRMHLAVDAVHLLGWLSKVEEYEPAVQVLQNVNGKEISSSIKSRDGIEQTPGPRTW